MTASDTAPASITAANAELIRRAYDAFAHGDIPTVLELLDTEITWHVPGRSPLSGDYRGHPGVLEFFARCVGRESDERAVARRL